MKPHKTECMTIIEAYNGDLQDFPPTEETSISFDATDLSMTGWVYQFKKVTKKELPFYFKDQLVLLNYCTYKNHLKEKKDLKPKEDPHYLNDDYFAEK